MAALGVRQTDWQSLTGRDKTILRAVGDSLDLGQPAQFDNGPVRWLVFDDWRYQLKHVAYLGCLIAHLADIPPGYVIPEDRDQLRADAKAFCDPFVVLPKDIVYSVPNVWQTTLDAQGTPGWVQMAGSVPATWTPFSPEE
jgi:hypothetical protein